MSNKVKVNVKLNGRPYSLRVLPQHEGLIRRAVERLNEKIRELKTHYELPDDTDILALVLLNETAGKEICLHEYDKSKIRLQENLEDIEHLLDRLEADINKD